MFKLFLFASFLMFSTTSQTSTKTTRKNVTKKSSISQEISKVQNRKPNANVMGKSKTDIRMILDAFQDSEGAFVQLIRKMPNETYKVDVKSITGVCVGHRIQILKLQNTETVNFLDRVYECD